MAVLKSGYKNQERVVIWVRPKVRDKLKIRATKLYYRSISSMLEDLANEKIKLVRIMKNDA